MKWFDKMKKKTQPRELPVIASVTYGKAKIAFWPARKFGRYMQHPFTLVSQFVNRTTGGLTTRRSLRAEELLDIPGACVLAAEWFLENQDLDEETQESLGMFIYLLRPFSQGSDGKQAVERLGRKHLEMQKKKRHVNGADGSRNLS